VLHPVAIYIVRNLQGSDAYTTVRSLRTNRA
jgi:hypothetical protein